MIKRIRLFYHTETNRIEGFKLSVREWVRYKVRESVNDLVYKDDFSAIYHRNRESGVYVVYAHTHRDAQKAIKKFFITSNTGE